MLDSLQCSSLKCGGFGFLTFPPLFLEHLIWQSPDGCTVASAAGDETLRFWNVFGTPEAAKPAQKAAPEPFANVNRIR